MMVPVPPAARLQWMLGWQSSSQEGAPYGGDRRQGDGGSLADGRRPAAQVAQWLRVVMQPAGAAIAVKLDMATIGALQLSVTPWSVMHAILRAPKLHLKMEHLRWGDAQGRPLAVQAALRGLSPCVGSSSAQWRPDACLTSNSWRCARSKAALGCPPPWVPLIELHLPVVQAKPNCTPSPAEHSKAVPAMQGSCSHKAATQHTPAAGQAAAAPCCMHRMPRISQPW